MNLAPLVPPAEMVDAVRDRVSPLFPGWSAPRIETLVCQMAALEWRYLVRNHGMPLPPLPRHVPSS